MPLKIRKVFCLGLVAALSLALSPSASQAEEQLACKPSNKQVSSLGTLTVGAILANMPSAQWGIEQGCFKKYGLEVKTSTVANIQIGMAGLVSGSIDVVMNTPTNLILFMANGDFDGKIVAPRHSYSASELTRAQTAPLYPGKLLLQTALIVKNDSPVHSWKDLEGKKIAVKSFQGTDQAGVMLAMKSAGVSASKVQFLAMSDSQMGPALTRGDVDAVIPSDPIATQIINSGAKVFAYPTSYFYEPGVAVVYVSSAQIVAKKTQAMRAFQKAILEINRLLNMPENQGSYRKTIATVTGVTEESLNQITFPTMSEKNVSFPEISYIPRKLKSLGFTRSRVNLAPILFN